MALGRQAKQTCRCWLARMTFRGAEGQNRNRWTPHASALAPYVLMSLCPCFLVSLSPCPHGVGDDRSACPDLAWWDDMTSLPTFQASGVAALPRRQVRGPESSGARATVRLLLLPLPCVLFCCVAIHHFQGCPLFSMCLPSSTAAVPCLRPEPGLFVRECNRRPLSVIATVNGWVRGSTAREALSQETRAFTTTSTPCTTAG